MVDHKVLLVLSLLRIFERCCRSAGYSDLSSIGGLLTVMSKYLVAGAHKDWSKESNLNLFAGW